MLFPFQSTLTKRMVAYTFYRWILGHKLYRHSPSITDIVLKALKTRNVRIPEKFATLGARVRYLKT